jgi:signal transduction histidine kinase
MARVVAGEPARMVGRTVELAGLRKDGREVPIELSLASWFEGDQRLFSGIMRDITERRDLARMKEEFLSMISHELRTPIGAVAGALELVLTAMGEDLPPRVRKIVEIADANIQRLGRLVSDLLDMHQMEWGRVKMYPEPVEASELASHALASLQLEAARLDVDLRMAPFRAWVQADGDRIVQLLTNLIGNALKYSPPGGTVTVGARAEGARLTVSVADEGRGVPEDALEHIFERFVQVRPVEARVRGGAGLGLAICRSIIERHGGRIWAENRPEGGSVFHFTLPLIDPPGRPAQAP